MAVDKNFVVKNGLEVKSNLIVADTSLDSVGIGTSYIKEKLHVIGGVGATTLYVGGIGTVHVAVGNTARYDNISISGVSTAAEATILGITSTKNLTVSGVSTFQTGFATNLTAQSLTVTGVTTFAGAIADLTATSLKAPTGVSTNFTATNLRVTGVSTLTGNATVGTGITMYASAGIVSATELFAEGVKVATAVTATSFTGALTGDVTGDVSGNAGTFTVTANNSTDETVYPVFVDGATGSQGAESDTGLNYNPNTGNLTAGKFTGDGSGLTDLSLGGEFSWIRNQTGIGTADNVGLGTTSAYNALTVVGNASISGVATVTGAITASGGVTGDVTGDVTGNADTATTATNVTVTANNNTNETVYPIFVDGATGNQGAESDTGLTYNPNSGTLTATSFSGDGSNLSGIDATTVKDGGGTTRLEGNTSGVKITGIATATTFKGALTGEAGTAIVAGIATYTTNWTLGADGTSNYTFTGPGLTGAENDPALYVVRGQQYKITNSSGGHPFRIQSTANGSTGTIYNDGITNNDAGNGTTLLWNVQFDAPDLLYYQCTSHGNMGGKIYVGNSGATATLESAKVSDLTSGRVVFAGTGGELSDASTLAFNSSTGVLSSTFSGNITGNVTGNTSGSSGSCTGNAASADTVDTTATSSDATYYPVFVDSSSTTAGETIRVDGGLTYNPSTNVLSATSFTGNVTGNVTGNATGSSGSCTGNAATATNADVADAVDVSNITTDAAYYAVFTDNNGSGKTLGVDAGLTYNPSTNVLTASGGVTATLTGNVTGNVTGNCTGSSGSCTGNAATATLSSTSTITANNSTNETVYPVFVDGATGTQGLESDTGLTYNPSTGRVTATSYAGDGSAMTGVGFTVFAYAYNPDVNGHVNAETGIGITWNQKVLPGTGDINLRRVSAAGTIAQGWDVDTAEVSFASNGTETIMQSVNEMEPDSVYCVEIPGNALTAANGASYVGTAYTFYTVAAAFKLFLWGQNNQGSLGQNQGPGQKGSQTNPIGLMGDNNDFNKTKPYGGQGDGSMGLIDETTGKNFAWGNNEGKGVLGVNDRISRSSPTQIPGTTWIHGNNNFDCTHGIKTDNTLWAWGRNNNGALGLNNKTDYSSPVQVPGTNWSTDKRKFTGGNNQYTGAIKTDGTLWTWGGNQYGQLGQNEESNSYSSPRQVPGTNWQQIQYANGSNALAVKTDGTLWSWGPNFKGQLGFPPAYQFYRRSSPMQIPGTNWKYAGMNTYSAACTRTDGTLWTWGYNQYGQLGLGNQSDKASPNQVPGTNWLWVEGARTAQHMFLAMRTDKSLWSWGHGSEGRLGVGNNQNYSSPRQVPGTWGDGGSDSYKWFTNTATGGMASRYVLAP